MPIRHLSARTGTSLSRLDAVRLTALHDASVEEGLDRVTRLGGRLLDAPVVLINFIEGDREVCMSAFDRSDRYRAGGVSPLESSACRHVVEGGAPLVVQDTRESPLLRSLPAVQAGRLGAYLGVPLRTAEGHVVGSLCALDVQPRAWSEDDLSALCELAAGAVAEIQVRADLALREAAEVELERTTRRLRVILEESAIGIALVDLAGRPVEVNPALERMLGYSADELFSKDFTEVTHRDDVALDWGLFAELIGGKRSHYQIEKRYLRKDGEVLWARLTVSAPRDEEGNPTAILAMVEDLTEHRQVEALQERVRILEGLLPICMFCKAIRNDAEEWERLESYISHRSAATFTHGCCPTCAHTHFALPQDQP